MCKQSSSAAASVYVGMVTFTVLMMTARVYQKIRAKLFPSSCCARNPEYDEFCVWLRTYLDAIAKCTGASPRNLTWCDRNSAARAAIDFETLSSEALDHVRSRNDNSYFARLHVLLVIEFAHVQCVRLTSPGDENHDWSKTNGYILITTLSHWTGLDRVVDNRVKLSVFLAMTKAACEQHCLNEPTHHFSQTLGKLADRGMVTMDCLNRAVEKDTVHVVQGKFVMNASYLPNVLKACVGAVNEVTDERYAYVRYVHERYTDNEGIKWVPSVRQSVNELYAYRLKLLYENVYLPPPLPPPGVSVGDSDDDAAAFDGKAAFDEMPVATVATIATAATANAAAVSANDQETLSFGSGSRTEFLKLLANVLVPLTKVEEALIGGRSNCESRAVSFIEPQKMANPALAFAGLNDALEGLIKLVDEDCVFRGHAGFYVFNANNFVAGTVVMETLVDLKKKYLVLLQYVLINFMNSPTDVDDETRFTKLSLTQSLKDFANLAEDAASILMTLDPKETPPSSCAVSTGGSGGNDTSGGNDGNDTDTDESSCDATRQGKIVVGDVSYIP